MPPLALQTPIMKKSEPLPRQRPLHARAKRVRQSCQTSNMVVRINAARTLWRLPAIQTSKRLEFLASVHAKFMASKDRLENSLSTKELKELMDSNTVGMDTDKGDSVEAIYNHLLYHSKHFRTKAFTECGIGTAAASQSGETYVCLLFRA